jgi:AraC-like DNA-binding protein
MLGLIALVHWEGTVYHDSMRPIREAIELQADCSSRWVRWRTDDLGWYWHCHDECEISLVMQGDGLRHVGDHQGPYRPGQAVLLGPGLPHGWRSDGSKGRQDLIALQFRPADLLRRFRGAPEASDLERILRAAGRGLLLDGPSGRQVCALVERLERTSGLDRLVGLLTAIAAFAPVLDQPLASPRWQAESDEQHPVIATLSSWLAEHAHQPIGLAEAATFVGMNPSACARLFRRHTAHSVVGWLNHLRVGRACDLLRDTDRKVAEIAFEAGFGNLANFNRVFRSFIGQTPRDYRRAFRDQPLAE